MQNYEASSSSANSEVFDEEGFLKSILFSPWGNLSIIERIADARAENGAEQNRLFAVDELLSMNMTNLEAAHGRYSRCGYRLGIDTLCGRNVKVQAAASMVAQTVNYPISHSLF